MSPFELCEIIGGREKDKNGKLRAGQRGIISRWLGTVNARSRMDAMGRSLMPDWSRIPPVPR